MPADPNVYRAVEPVSIVTPQQFQLQQNAQQLTLADQQQKLTAARDQAMARSVLARYPNDPEAALVELRRVAPTAAPAFEKSLNESRKTAIENLKATNEVQKFRTERGLDFLQLARATNNPAAYAAARHNLAMDDDDLEAFPEQMPDPQTLDQMLQMGLSVKDRYDLHEKALNHYASGDLSRGFAASLLSAGNDPEAWKEAQQAGIQMGVPKAFAASFGDQPTPEAIARAKDLSLTQQEREAIRRDDLSAENTRTDNERQAAAQAETVRHNKEMERRAATRTATQQADVSALSPGAIDLAALNYRKTGVMPPLGMGDKNNRQAILNRAATLTPDDITRIEASGQDIAGNKAGYKADSTSLTNLQKQRDAIDAFERTAQKNIDIFLDTAGKVVDTGSPLANSVARVISGKVLGSPDQTAYDAARQVALSEIARIVQNPNLTGQLSDSARAEIEAFNPNNATLKQSVAVMRLLKRDMQNRKSSLDAALADVKGRISGGSAGVSVKAPNGKTYIFKSQADADAFKQKAGIQ